MLSSETPSSRYHWQESPDGIWQRDIDECERFYFLSARSRNGFFPITACASFTINFSNATSDDEEQKRVETALQKAWCTLRHSHPTLGSRIQYDAAKDHGKRIYAPLQQGHEEEDWLHSTFKVVECDEGPSSWFDNETALLEMPTIFLLKTSKENSPLRTVFLQCPHDITDGIGILQLIDQLFDYAARAYEQGDKFALPEWGAESTRLSPSLRIAAGIPDSVPEAHIIRFKDIQSQNAAIYQHPGLLGLPFHAAAPRSADDNIQRVAISAPEVITETILTSCKGIAPGVTITHVFMSALTVALSKLQPQKEETYPARYISHSMINLRPHCIHPYNGPDHAAASYHTVSAQALSIDLHVAGSTEKTVEDPNNQFADIATKVRDFYKNIRPAASTDGHEQINLAPLMFEALTPPPNSNAQSPSEPLFCPVSLSSIGNLASMVASSHGPFNLASVWAASEPVGPGFALFLASWNGRTELSGTFNARFHDGAYVKSFLQSILDCVCEGLGIGCVQST